MFADSLATEGGGGGTVSAASIAVKVLKNGQEVNQQNPLQEDDPFSLVILGSDISKLYGYSIDFKYDPLLMEPAQEPFTTNGSLVFAERTANYGFPFTRINQYPTVHQNTLTIVEHLVESDTDPTTTVPGVSVAPNTVLGTLNFVSNTSEGNFLIKTGDSLAQLGVNGVNLTVALADDTPEANGQTTQPIPYQIPGDVALVFGEYVPDFVTVEDVTTKKQGHQVTIAGTTNLSQVDIKIFAPDQTQLITVTETPTSLGEYSYAYTLGFDAPLGTYTIVVGRGGVEATDTFEVIDGIAPAPVTFNPQGGTYASAQSVTLSAEAGTTIYYTTDGSVPTTSSSQYSAPFGVSASTTVKAIAVDALGNVSQVAVADYIIHSETPGQNNDFGKIAFDAVSNNGEVNLDIILKDIELGMNGFQISIPVPQGAGLSNPVFTVNPASGLTIDDVDAEGIANGVYKLVIGGSRLIQSPLNVAEPINIGTITFDTQLSEEFDLSIDEIIVNQAESDEDAVNLQDVVVRVTNLNFIEVPEGYNVYDVNRDGTVNVSDYTQVLLRILEKHRKAPIPFDESRRVLISDITDDMNFYDVNLDGTVNVSDYTQVLLRILEKQRKLEFTGFVKQ